MHQVQITKVNRPMETVKLATATGISEGGGPAGERPRVTAPVLQRTGQVQPRSSILQPAGRNPQHKAVVTWH